MGEKNGEFLDHPASRLPSDLSSDLPGRPAGGCPPLQGARRQTLPNGMPVADERGPKSRAGTG